MNINQSKALYTTGNINNKVNWYFLFVNTKSGNKQGLKYLQLGTKKLTYVFGEGLTSIIEIFDLFDKERIKLGLQAIKELSSKQKNNNVRLIICGGDGTIPWVLSLGLQYKINFQNVIIGILPIGTGNDLSRSIGWGYKSIEFNSKSFEKLHSIIKLWNQAEIGHYDIWDIQIETNENGGFYQIKNQQQVKIDQKILKKSFTNYFGIGLDGRIVYSVQKNRGSNAFINKLLYTFVGAKKFFTPMQSVDNSIITFKQKKSQKINKDMEQKIVKKQAQQNLSLAETTIQVTTDNTDPSNEIHFKLKKGYKGLVCLNCTSYMCGLREVWMTKKSTNQNLQNMERQYFNDGSLEFMTFKNQLTLALQRIIRTGVRVAKGSGPFEIQFQNNKQDPTTYMQIDGQSLRIEYIKSIKVIKSSKYPQSRIKVLINKQN